ncbi:MAG: FAD:protein FMN transferase [Terracidiphilus sp.]|jgi:thiamine biosynthesis lipoprotein
MGTEFTLYLDAADEVQAQACFDAVFDEIDRLEGTFSRFRASSEISRLNREATDGPMVTDPEVFQLLAAALDVSRKTEGAFDITVGRLTQAWGFSARQAGIPDARTLAAAQECVGWTNIELDHEWRTVEFLRPGLKVDLGGIAKGYAVDCAMGVLRSVGVQGLIDAGSSSIAATDVAFARSWEVSIANPLDASATLCQVELGNRALSTSGIMEQSFVQDGRIYCHLIDPTAPGAAASAPARQMLQVTVMAPSSMLADALSTAMFILGCERGRIALEQFPDCSAFWIYSGAEGIQCAAHQWPRDNFR